jgi:hypothetical protein
MDGNTWASNKKKIDGLTVAWNTLSLLNISMPAKRNVEERYFHYKTVPGHLCIFSLSWTCIIIDLEWLLVDVFGKTKGAVLY